MNILHPGEIIQKIQDNRKEKREVLQIFSDRIDYALSKKDPQEPRKITASLKNHGVTATALKGLTETASVNVSAFLRHEIRIIKGNPTLDKGTKTFADVCGDSSFMKIAVTLRELYADDIASALSYEDAFEVIIEKFLFHS